MSAMNSSFQPANFNLFDCVDFNNYNWSSNKVENDDFLFNLERTAGLLQEKWGQDLELTTPTPSPTHAEVPDMHGYSSPSVNTMEPDVTPQFRMKIENPNRSPQSLYFDSLSPQDGSNIKSEPVKSIQSDFSAPSPNHEVPNGSPNSFYYDISSPNNRAYFKSDAPSQFQNEDAPNGSPGSLSYDYESISLQDDGFFKREMVFSHQSDCNATSPQYSFNNEAPAKSPACYEPISPQDGSFFKLEGVDQLPEDCSSPQLTTKDCPSERSPNSLYYECISPPDGNSFKNEFTKPRMKDECLVSLLSAPAKPMANTITDTIISQLGHANSDNTKGGSSRGRIFNNAQIKTEIIDTPFIKQEKSSPPADMSFDMDSSSACQLPSDICAFAFQNVCAEIQAVCEKIQISRDPRKWSADDVKLWIMKTLKDYNFPTVSADTFQMNGIQLCELDLQEFSQKVPLCGNILFSQLEIWKTTCHSGEFPLEQFANQPPVLVDNYGQWNNDIQMPVSSPDSSSNSDTNLMDLDMRQSDEGCSPAPPATSPGFSHVDEISSDDEVMEKVTPDISAHTQTRKKPGSSHSQIHLYEFLWNLLNDPCMYGNYIRWLDRHKGIFKIEDSAKVANLWGIRKNRPAMNYDKMSRSIRQYYRKQIMKKTTKSQRLVYQFCLEKLQDENGGLAKKTRKPVESRGMETKRPCA